MTSVAAHLDRTIDMIAEREACGEPDLEGEGEDHEDMTGATQLRRRRTETHT